MKKLKVLTIGAAMRDLFLHYEKPHILTVDEDRCTRSFIALEEGTKIEIASLAYHTGGGGINSAISFKKLGFGAESFFKIGADADGDFIIKTLKSHKISLKHIARSTQTPTGISCIIPTPSGNRAILVYRGANATISMDDIPKRAIATCDQLYVTSLSAQTSQLLPHIAAIAKQHGALVAVNPGTSQLTVRVDTLIKAMKNIDILIVNCLEASLLINSFDKKVHRKYSLKKTKKKLPGLLDPRFTFPRTRHSLLDYFQAVLEHGPRIAVVTNGADGVYATDGAHIYYHPSLPITAVSTVGAGDAFGSTFVGMLSMGKPIDLALRAGIINSASVLSHLGTTTGLLTLKELNARIKKLSTQLLQTFMW